ncbi:MAG: two-component system response regulator [Spirochaetes bacterium GWF1_31_7]|nr:MAG: two-component system response regulator [Spirochaetes bacterium GWE1_32_154]OHD50795.1 MAG: two-component system response regulator [Spirochaetes bacterium GWE2_31_10]OHD52732.1 MAG: two-component system response regulator [Spirochaetes bacterium GWF1_31_7]OHD78542.1 MAG: two-component system response regulator [Spirochaetes bacterium RIFOXYB1_FULL_32_8]HBD95407.1 two-component system response regulator [Spirochaetia bacterium]
MGARVLIVDDLAFIKLIIRDTLEKTGFEVAGEASNGIEAIEQYKRLKPDIVLMDITMPRMDGIQALQEIIKFDSSARIIMCSALGQQKLIIQSIQLGAKDFIVKPFKPERIVGAIKKALNMA